MTPRGRSILTGLASLIAIVPKTMRLESQSQIQQQFENCPRGTHPMTFTAKDRCHADDGIEYQLVGSTYHRITSKKSEIYRSDDHNNGVRRRQRKAYKKATR